jgi:hypothetical protein
MFLPALMIDRFGWPGFAVFAVPNVLGCAAFGYVVSTRQRSEMMVQQHGRAMVVFSLIAVAYHLFFLPFLFMELTPLAADAPGIALLATLVVFGVGLAISWLGDRGWPVLAVLVYALSLIAFAMIGFTAWDRLIQSGQEPLSELAWLAPVIAGGFLLCPYLDLTFHRALQRSPSRHAFGVFGVTFTVMIVLTCFLWFADMPALHVAAVAHIVAQTIFTVGAHLREVRLSASLRTGVTRAGLMILPLLAALLLPMARGIAPDAPGLGEDLYLRFLVFYGLAFPAYVLVFIGPMRPARRTTFALFTAVIVIVVLSPLYELAFLHGRAWLMVVPTGLAIVWVSARLATKMRGRRPPASLDAPVP